MSDSDHNQQFTLSGASKIVDSFASELEFGQSIDRDNEVEDRVAFAWGQMSIRDRLVAAAGNHVKIIIGALAKELHFDGRLAEVGPDWLLLSIESNKSLVRQDVIIPMARVSSIQGDLSAHVDSGSLGRMWKSRTLVHVLRSADLVMRDVTLEMDYGVCSGRIVRVGIDHLDIELVNRGGTMIVAFSGLVAVKVDHWE